MFYRFADSKNTHLSETETRIMTVTRGNVFLLLLPSEHILCSVSTSKCTFRSLQDRRKYLANLIAPATIKEVGNYLSRYELFRQVNFLPVSQPYCCANFAVQMEANQFVYLVIREMVPGFSFNRISEQRLFYFPLLLPEVAAHVDCLPRGETCQPVPPRLTILHHRGDGCSPIGG